MLLWLVKVIDFECLFVLWWWYCNSFLCFLVIKFCSFIGCGVMNILFVILLCFFLIVFWVLSMMCWLVVIFFWSVIICLVFFLGRFDVIWLRLVFIFLKLFFMRWRFVMLLFFWFNIELMLVCCELFDVVWVVCFWKWIIWFGLIVLMIWVVMVILCGMINIVFGWCFDGWSKWSLVDGILIKCSVLFFWIIICVVEVWFSVNSGVDDEDDEDWVLVCFVW